MSNFKQIGLGAAQYAMDNNEYLSNIAYGYSSLVRMLNPYVKAPGYTTADTFKSTVFSLTGVWLCPSARTISGKTDKPYLTNYVQTLAYINISDPPKKHGPWLYKASGIGTFSNRLATISPNCILLYAGRIENGGDGNYRASNPECGMLQNLNDMDSAGQPKPDGPNYVHQGRDNFLMNDMSVRSLKFGFKVWDFNVCAWQIKNY